MPSAGTAAYWALIVAWSGVVYQFYIKDFLAVTVGIGRVIQSIDEFPFECRQVRHPKLEACEDMWIDDEKRVLYAACYGVESRLNWNPAIDKLNGTGRVPGASNLVALDIDSDNELFNLRTIRPAGYTGATDDSTIDFVGFDAQVVDENTIHFYFVNARPPIGPFGNVMDASVLGANSTVDIFEMLRGEDQMRHVRTVMSPAMFTPNRPAAVGGDAFFFTNDHSTKIGMIRKFEPIVGGGNIAYCNGKGECHAAYNDNEVVERSKSAVEPKYKEILNSVLDELPKPKLKFPNGLARGRDGLIYVPSSVDGQIRVFSINDDKTLRKIDTIHVGMPLDNLSPSANGDLYVPGFPDLQQLTKGLADPLNEICPVTIFRIRKTVDVSPEGLIRSLDYRVEKVIEDKEGKVLNGVTTVRHDAKTGRLFLGAVAYPYIMVCDPK